MQFFCLCLLQCAVGSRHPLILTPLLGSGQIQEARSAAEVHHPQIPIRSYSGFFTVNKVHNSNLYFWFFPSFTNYPKAPVVLWLQGGPGSSSFYGLFVENGPFKITNSGSLSPRLTTWVRTTSVIYIDSPVGVGFSFTEGGYAENESTVGRDLYEALLQFFQMFPELKENDFYICGESYAGKFVPAIGYTIMKNNPRSRQKINLKGLAIGNAWVDPITQYHYADYWYQNGLIDLNTKNRLENLEEKAIGHIRNKQWRTALEMTDYILEGASIFKNHTGFKYCYSLLDSTNSLSDTMTKTVQFVERPDVRRSLHVGAATFNMSSHEVAKHLSEDFMQSVSALVSELLNVYPILFYHGQFDACIPYTGIVNFLRSLKFRASEEYKTTPRHIWRVGKDVAGYVKRAGNLMEILVLNSGHMVPTDQPEWALDLITRFTHKMPFY